MPNYLTAVEVSSPASFAIVEERYSALRRQVPVIYILVLVNLFGLQLAATGVIELGLNPPTALLVCALVRSFQWFQPRGDISFATKLRLLKQTALVTFVACLLLCAWFLNLMRVEPDTRLVVLLFGALTAIGTAYGLSSYPYAARIPLVFLALPLSAGAIFWQDTRYAGAGVSLAVVSLLLVHLLEEHNRHFRNLIETRSIIAGERELAEAAKARALVAATTDFLTGLLNRRAFVSAIDDALAQADRFVVAIVDLDRFKPMNDTFGHAAGDELLRVVAERLRGCISEGGSVARIGGDEFAVMLPLSDQIRLENVGELLLDAVTAPATIHERLVSISACCGIAFAGQGTSASLLLSHADIALYEAKGDPGRAYAIFEPIMAAPRRRRVQVERALQHPDTSDKVSILFQPIVELRTGRILSVEALARWTDEELGEVSPAEFIPIAEQLNVIGLLSDKLMHRAIQEAIAWPTDVRLSMNLSAVQLSLPQCADGVLRALQQQDFPPERLQVEVTETALMADFEAARRNLQVLRSAGVTVVLDDFGAGYASISYLREMTFDHIKLDGSLLLAAEANAERRRLLTAVIGLCAALGLGTVAEHIESEEQLDLLLTLGCTAGQGYYLHRPMSGEALRALTQDIRTYDPANLHAGTRSAA